MRVLPKVLNLHAALFFLLGTMVCHAKLGETEAQCMARYGAEFDPQDNLGFDTVGDKARSFNLKVRGGAAIITITFFNGIDSLEKISNADATSGLSDDQKKNILASESAGLTWNKQNTTFRTDRTDTTFETEYWLRGDGATARCWMFGKTKSTGWSEIELSSREYTAAQRELDRQNGTR